MATPIIILLMLLIVTIVCILGIFIKNNKSVTKVCIYIGAICIFIFGIYHLYFYDNQEKVEIHTSTEEDTTFVLPIKNHKIKYEYTYTDFSTDMDIDIIAKEIEKNNLADNMELLEKEIKITQNNHVITIRKQKSSSFLWKKRYEYNMEAEFLNLTFSQNSRVSIPFPTGYLMVEGAYETVMDISCDMETLKKFYEHFTNVEMNEEYILMKMDSGQVIKITLEGKKVKFVQNTEI